MTIDSVGAGTDAGAAAEYVSEAALLGQGALLYETSYVG